MPRKRGRSNASLAIAHDDDPLTLALQPPPDETPHARDERLRAEREAKRVSDEIDDELRRERAAMKRRRPVRVLLLGQSESGKSTTLKNFQIHYAPQAWHDERACWRAVVQLNLIRSVARVIAVVPPPVIAADPAYPALLARLADAERILQRRLSPTDADEPGDYRSFKAPDLDAPAPTPTPMSREFFVRPSSTPWKTRFLHRASTSSAAPSPPAPQRGSLDSWRAPAGHDPATEIVVECAPAMRRLWADERVRGACARGSVEDMPGFFLADVDRIAARGYEPSDDDVIRARLRTMGVQEHRFTFERGADAGREWRVYDVGGARSQRSSWLSFFDDMDAIIFLAPISCFDETLAEDRRVNRLEDSIVLWRTLCRSPLLAKVQLVLFLNKVDLLRRKIAAGARVARHVTSFGDRSNDFDTVCKYFKQKFKEMQKQYSPEPRPYYVYFTSVTDTKATGITLGIVREGILRANLQKADFL